MGCKYLFQVHDLSFNFDYAVFGEQVLHFIINSVYQLFLLWLRLLGTLSRKFCPKIT